MCICLAAGSLLLPPLAPPAEAQDATMYAGVLEGSKIMLRATVASVDMQAHTITLFGPQGEQLTLKAGDSVKNMQELKPGDHVKITTESVAVAVQPY